MIPLSHEVYEKLVVEKTGKTRWKSFSCKLNIKESCDEEKRAKFARGRGWQLIKRRIKFVNLISHIWVQFEQQTNKQQQCELNSKLFSCIVISHSKLLSFEKY